MAHNRGLIVDFGGVVTTRFRTALAGFCEREGLSPDRLHQVLRVDPAGKDTLYQAEIGKISQREFERRLGELLGVSDINLAARICAGLRPCQPMLELIEQVRKTGVGTAMLSNSLGAGGYDIYQDYDLSRYFDVIVISDQVALAKPDPAIYELTAGKLGLPTNECVFADDLPANLVPATALGMRTVLVDEPVDAVYEIAQHFGLGQTIEDR